MKIIENLKGFWVWNNWLYFVTFLILILIFVMAFYFFKKRGKSRKAEKSTGKEEGATGLPPLSLVKAWKAFLNQIPSEFRRLIMVYQHFVVFGESGAGKSLLINSHTDWQGHARQFYPSYTANPLLQVYLGSKVLVQEIPASLLNDTSKAARKALIKLWAPLFRRKDPTAMIVLNSASFQTDEPLFLKKQAQMIRGKINLLARIRKRPIKVRLVLTNMERYEGFPEFSRFLARYGIPLKLEFSSKEELARLAECLVPYEEHLPRALTSLPAEDYLKIMTFMDRAPELFKGLSRFIAVLQSPDPLTPEPEIATLSLAFLSEEQVSVSNPFATSLTSRDIQKFNPLFRHRVAAAVLGGIGLIYLVSSFFYEYKLIGERHLKIAVLEKAPLSQYNQNMHKLFVDPLTSMQQRTLMAFLPDFFPHADEELFRRGIENIRKFYLLPELEKFSVAENSWEAASLEDVRQVGDARNKVVYLLGLLYATRDNDLGALILDHIKEWTENTGVSSLLIEDYINYNKASYSVILDTNDYLYSRKKGIIDDPHALLVFLEKINRFYKQPVITRSEFHELMQETAGFLGKIRALERYDLSLKVAELLRREALLNIDDVQDDTAGLKSQIRHESIKKFLRFLHQSRITSPEITDEMNLAGLYENLKVMHTYKGFQSSKDELFHFMLTGREFKFGASQWNNLLNRSRMTLFLNDFINHNKRNDGMLFFLSKEDFPDLVMNTANDGMFLFKGQARVDGRFTRNAFEKRVKPVLTELPGFIESLPVPEKDKIYFSNFLFKEIDAYGRRYASAYQNYYMDFEIQARSLASLRYVLRQLTLPNSPFMEVLLAVKDNTLLDTGDNTYLASFARKMEAFEFLQRLLAEHKGVFPELDKYKAFLEQMLFDIGNGSSQARDLKDFKKRLSPIGQISFAILQDGEESYLNLIKQWVKSVGIPKEWQGVFKDPVYLAYYLGLPEIEDEIKNIWDALFESDIYSLYGFFPFNRTSTRDVPGAVLARATHPHGHFWPLFRSLLSPVFHEEAGVWRVRPSPIENPILPDQLIETVNAISRLTTTLWDPKGEPKSLEFMVRPYPLAAVRENVPVVALSYLHAGEFSLFGFNQQPSWKKLIFDWSRESSAAVGVELVTDDGTAKLQNAVAVGKSSWSFFHLLQKSDDMVVMDALTDPGEAPDAVLPLEHPGDSDVYGNIAMLTWVVHYSQKDRDTHPETGLVRGGEADAVKVRFGIQTRDPWAIFILPQ
ncbi:hypothetical protein [Desulfoluna sp.]|uniref:hypothetical protein n=1 Tax=Desulfoluna sp. TaxID=2045199 RepID=UPI002618ECB4|nr:hypothetical protein [Desulfoluna sp.]